MLLTNSGFVPLLVEGLLLSEGCFRKDADATVKASVQRDFAECIQQCAAYAPGCEALQQSEHMGAVMEALEALKEHAWTGKYSSVNDLQKHDAISTTRHLDR